MPASKVPVSTSRCSETPNHHKKGTVAKASSTFLSAGHKAPPTRPPLPAASSLRSSIAPPPAVQRRRVALDRGEYSNFSESERSRARKFCHVRKSFLR